MPTRKRRNSRKTGSHKFFWGILLAGAALTAACYFPSPDDREAAPDSEEKGIEIQSVPNAPDIPQYGEPKAQDSQADVDSEHKDTDTNKTSLEEKVREFTSQTVKAAEKQVRKTTGNAFSEKKSPNSGSSSAKAVTPDAKKTQNRVNLPADGKVRLAVCIDDAGRDLNSQRVYEGLGIPLTLAVMPNEPHTSEAAAEWKSKGMPVIIHQPMESVSGKGMEKIVIKDSMSDEQIRSLIRQSIQQIPQASGMNNHQGSKATTDKRVMKIVMSELASRNMFFFDSATNTSTEADKAAALYHVPYARNNLFVDNSADVDAICRMIQKGAERARKNGSAIIIGHCRPNTAAAFKKMVPKLKAEGIEFVYLSSLTGK